MRARAILETRGSQTAGSSANSVFRGEAGNRRRRLALKEKHAGKKKKKNSDGPGERGGLLAGEYETSNAVYDKSRQSTKVRINDIQPDRAYIRDNAWKRCWLLREIYSGAKR